MNKYKKMFKFEIEETELDSIIECVGAFLKHKDNYKLRSTAEIYTKLQKVREADTDYERLYR